jgi:hypothetical protein
MAIFALRLIALMLTFGERIESGRYRGGGRVQVREVEPFTQIR